MTAPQECLSHRPLSLRGIPPGDLLRGAVDGEKQVISELLPCNDKSPGGGRGCLGQGGAQNLKLTPA